MQDTGLENPHVSLDSPISLTSFLTQRPNIRKRVIYIDVTMKIRPNIITVKFLTYGSLFNL